MRYIELKVKQALNKVSSQRLPFYWDLNIYRWCSHWCKYCFAIYSHWYLDNNNFFWSIYYKNPDELIASIEKQISSPKWKWQSINIWWVTDSYQLIEWKFGTMRRILKLMIKYKNPINISTKSAIIVRDIDLIDELSRVVNVNIAFTITTTDEKLREELEPWASTTIGRINALKALKKTNASLWIHLMPIIPYLTDTYENIESILKVAYDLKIQYILPWILHLRWKHRYVFFDFIKNYDKEIYKKIYNLFSNKELKQEYKMNFYKMYWEIKKKYNVNSNYKKYTDKRIEEDSKQLALNFK